jgi:hypothetical protein
VAVHLEPTHLEPGVLRLALSWATGALSERFGIDSGSYYPRILSFFVLQIPLLFGILVGLLVLDQ